MKINVENLDFLLIAIFLKRNYLKIPVPNIQENTLLVGFPSTGLIGTFSISYLINYLKMENIGEIEVADLPSSLFVEGGEILAPIRIYKKNNIFAIISDVPFDQYLVEEFAHSVHAFCKENQVKKMVFMSGMESINQKKDEPKIFGLITHKVLESLLYNYKIPKFLDGSIYGTDAALISVFRKTKIPLLVLYAECHPFFPDPKASINAIVILAKILNVKVDTNEIQKRLDKIRIQHRNLMEETLRTLQEKPVRAPQIYR